MQAIRNTGVVFFSLLTLAATIFMVNAAIHSSLFLVQVVEIETDPGPGLDVASETAEDPINAETISDLAAVPIGRANLFSLDLSQVEARILANEWVRAVTLQKRFPQTLSISVSFRKPLALVQNGDGSLSYLDQDARPFGRVNLSYQPDLPILVSSAWGREPGAPDLAQALELLERWNSSTVAHFAQISSLGWEPERGFHATAVYRLKTYRPGSRGPALGRTLVELGNQSQGSDGAPLERLAEVFRYLHESSVPVRQIWADAGKKIVVKTARGS